MLTIKKFAKIGVFILAFALLFTACGTGGQTTTSSAAGQSLATGESDVLRVGIEGACAPFNWMQLDDTAGAVSLEDGSFMGGYDVEIAKLIAQGMGKKLVVYKIDWDGLIPSLTAGKIDAILADMSPTEERRQTIDFSDIYYKSDLVVVLPKNSPYVNASSINGFSGATITGQLNTLLYTVVAQMPGVTQGAPLADHPTMIIATLAGKVDGYVAERPSAISAALANPQLTFVAFEEGQGFEYDGTDVSIAVGLAKNSPYTKQINQILAGISEEQRQQIMEDCIAKQPLGAE